MNQLVDDSEVLRHVSKERIVSRIEELAQVGGADGSGVTRLALSPEEHEARVLVAAWLQALGYECGLDSACNLVCRAPGDRGIVVGSHLDTVPNGGRYDGALGVVAAVEAAEALVAAQREVHPRVVAWMGEEGPRFGRALLGSSLALGLAEPEVVLRQDRTGAPVADLTRRWLEEWGGATNLSATHGAKAYLELHIEQGSRLVSMGQALGVVDSIVGVSHARLEVSGRADHAGTTPMGARRDALVAAAEMVVAAETTAVMIGRDLVVTVGEIGVEPGAMNVVPEKADLSLDVRAPADATRARFFEVFAQEVGAIAARRGVSADLSVDYEINSVELNRDLRRLLVDCLPLERGQLGRELWSGAIHDAQSWALAGYRSGMIFVQSVGGSHNPLEHVNVAHAVRGVEALIRAICRLSESSIT